MNLLEQFADVFCAGEALDGAAYKIVGRRHVLAAIRRETKKEEGYNPDKLWGADLQVKAKAKPNTATVLFKRGPRRWQRSINVKEYRKRCLHCGRVL